MFEFLIICFMAEKKFLVNLGANIKEIRLKKKLTQNDLAIQCHFEKASMSRIESGKTNVTVLTLRKISNALEVDMQEFFRN